ncbi:MAG: OmpA family protein [Rhodospirillales bacterium]|nr:OmpA family protein [Rhodospirillales bacterium]
MSPRHRLRLAILAAGLTALAGCASQADNAQLQLTESRFQQTTSDPRLAQNAPVELYEAQNALKAAQAAPRDNPGEASHLAYLAEKKLEIAQAASARKEAVRQRETLAERSNQTMLGARTAQLQEAQRRADLLAQQLEGYQRMNNGNLMASYDLLFETGQSTMQPGALRRLDPLVSYLQNNPNTTVSIAGYTDSVGSPSTNDQLSQARAEAVRNYLASRGVEGNRIVAQGYGEAFPVASNETSAGRQQNRRVEVQIAQAPGGQSQQTSQTFQRQQFQSNQQFR